MDTQELKGILTVLKEEIENVAIKNEQSRVMLLDLVDAAFAVIDDGDDYYSQNE